jgi:hypothetical protein
MTDLPLNRQKRDGTADLLKGFAVLFMIQVHIMEQFVAPDTSSSMIGKISMFLGGPPCAPVFLAVMGYFLAVSAQPLSFFLKRGTILFFGGILLNSARSANLLIQVSRGELNLDPWFFILGADIFTLAGLSLILTGLLRILFRDKTLLYFIAALAVVGISPFLSTAGVKGSDLKHLVAFIYGTEGWSYFPLFPWFAYVLAGYSFRLFLKQTPVINKIDVQTQFIYFIPLWVVILITIPYASAITSDLAGPGGYYHHGILFFGWTLLFMISHLVMIRLVEINYGNFFLFRLVKWIGLKVTLLYVIQWLIIGNIATYLYRSQDLFQFVAWFVIVTFATCLTGILITKILKRQSQLFS